MTERIVYTMYLASRYGRRLELCEYRDQLVADGHSVTSRWLNGDHQIDDQGQPIGESGERIIESDSEDGAALRARFAQEDLDDVCSCVMFVAFTEPPRSGASRGGRHVELGVAIALGLPIIIVGPRENLFCWHPNVRQFDTFEAFRDALNEHGNGSETVPPL